MTGPTTITLRALAGEPLEDESVRDMVIATANAIAERHGVRVIDVVTDDSSITVTLGTGRIEALGFAAELRRLTGRWYAHKHGGPGLWGDGAEEDPPHGGSDS